MRWLRFLWHAANSVEVNQTENTVTNENPFPDPIVLEITDVMDLHSIPPKQIKAIIEEYLYQAHERGFPFVRIIHGKGIGVQREMTRKILAATPFVKSFSDAPPEAGGWGATIVELQILDGGARNKKDGVSDRETE